MIETRADNRVALLQAAGLHVVLLALMFAGLHWTRSDIVEAARGEVIEADLIDPSALSASMQRALQRDPEALPEPVREPIPMPTPPEPMPEPAPEPLPQPVPEQLPAPVQEPDNVDQEKVQRDAIAPNPAKAQREQEAKRRQQQVDLDARQQTEMERMKQLQLAEIRKQREQAQREVRNAEQRAQQLADAKVQQAQSRAPPPGDPNSRSADNAGYVQALQAAILRQWTRPESVRLGQRCRISIRQLPGGEVVDVTVSPACPFDELGRQSVERAVLKASPLPYAGFEDAFDRILNLNFVAEEP